VTGWTRRARLAARRAQRIARTGAIRIQRAGGEMADRFRHRGRQAAVKDIDVIEMAGLGEKKGGKLLERSVTATLERDRGPLPDPAWTAGYRDVAAARVPGFARQPVAVGAPAAEPAEPAEPRPAWPAAPEGSEWPFKAPDVEAPEADQPDPEAGS
jgi:hypothetical protein